VLKVLNVPMGAAVLVQTCCRAGVPSGAPSAPQHLHSSTFCTPSTISTDCTTGTISADTRQKATVDAR